MTTKTKRVSPSSKNAPVTEHQSADSAAHDIEAECAALVRSVKLSDLRLIDTSAKLHTDQFGAEAAEVLHVYTDVVQTCSERIAPDKLYCGVRISVKASHAKDGPAAITVYGEYSLIYDIASDLKFHQDASDKFAAKNGVFNAWPFFRELMHAATARMGLPAVTMSSYKLPLLTPPPPAAR